MNHKNAKTATTHNYKHRDIDIQKIMYKNILQQCLEMAERNQ